VFWYPLIRALYGNRKGQGALCRAVVALIFPHALNELILFSAKDDRGILLYALVLLRPTYRFRLPWCDKRSEAYRDRRAMKIWRGYEDTV